MHDARLSTQCENLRWSHALIRLYNRRRADDETLKNRLLLYFTDPYLSPKWIERASIHRTTHSWQLSVSSVRMQRAKFSVKIRTRKNNVTSRACEQCEERKEKKILNFPNLFLFDLELEWILINAQGGTSRVFILFYFILHVHSSSTQSSRYGDLSWHIKRIPQYLIGCLKPKKYSYGNNMNNVHL